MKAQVKTPVQNAPARISIRRKLLGISEVEFEPDDCCEKLRAENERLKKENAELKEKLRHALIPFDEEIIGETRLDGNE